MKRDWGKIGVIVSVIPLLVGFINWLMFGPINVNGNWLASDPTNATDDNRAINNRCIILRQKPFSSAVHGSFFNDANDVYFLGFTTNSQLELNYVTYSKADNEGTQSAQSGEIKMTAVNSNTLRGLWTELSSSNNIVGGPGRWTLTKTSKSHCEDISF